MLIILFLVLCHLAFMLIILCLVLHAIWLSCWLSSPWFCVPMSHVLTTMVNVAMWFPVACTFFFFWGFLFGALFLYWAIRFLGACILWCFFSLSSEGLVYCYCLLSCSLYPWLHPRLLTGGCFHVPCTLITRNKDAFLFLVPWLPLIMMLEDLVSSAPSAFPSSRRCTLVAYNLS